MVIDRINTAVIRAHPVAEGVSIRVGSAEACAVHGRANTIEISVHRVRPSVRDTLERVPLVRGIVRLFAIPSDLFRAMRRGERLRPREICRGSPFVRRFASLFQTTPTKLYALLDILAALALIPAVMWLLPELVEALLLRMPDLTRMAVNVVCCMFRALGFILSAYTISRLRIFRRISEYHSAAKKVINAYEIYGENFTDDEVWHTSFASDHSDMAFILITAVLWIVAFAFLRPEGLLIGALRRLGLALAVTAVYNEIHMLLENAKPSGLIRKLRKPMEHMELVCALEPSDDMIEAAVHAFNAAYESDQEEKDTRREG